MLDEIYKPKNKTKFNNKKSYLKFESELNRELPEFLKSTPFDIIKDTKYDGQTVCVLQFVPYFARDQKTIIDVRTLRAWLTFAIIEVCPFVPILKKRIEKQKQKISVLDDYIDDIVNQVYLDENGQYMSEELAEKYRAEKMAILNLEKENLFVELKRRENLLERHKIWRSAMDIRFEEGNLDEKSQTMLWYLNTVLNSI